MLDMQEIEDEHGKRGNRSVSEIKDTGRLKRKHQTGARQAVDSPGCKSNDNEREKRGHSQTSLIDTSIRFPKSPCRGSAQIFELHVPLSNWLDPRTQHCRGSIDTRHQLSRVLWSHIARPG